MCCRFLMQDTVQLWNEIEIVEIINRKFNQFENMSRDELTEERNGNRSIINQK